MQFCSKYLLQPDNSSPATADFSPACCAKNFSRASLELRELRFWSTYARMRCSVTSLVLHHNPRQFRQVKCAVQSYRLRSVNSTTCSDQSDPKPPVVLLRSKPSKAQVFRTLSFLGLHVFEQKSTKVPHLLPHACFFQEIQFCSYKIPVPPGDWRGDSKFRTV